MLLDMTTLSQRRSKKLHKGNDKYNFMTLYDNMEKRLCKF